MTDREHLAAMRALGVKWRQGAALPTYPATMDCEAMQAADEHYDAMSLEFTARMGERHREHSLATKMEGER
jgi:hypothetical protein